MRSLGLSTLICLVLALASQSAFAAPTTPHDTVSQYEEPSSVLPATGNSESSNHRPNTRSLSNSFSPRSLSMTVTWSSEKAGEQLAPEKMRKIAATALMNRQVWVYIGGSSGDYGRWKNTAEFLRSVHVDGFNNGEPVTWHGSIVFYVNTGKAPCAEGRGCRISITEYSNECTAYIEAASNTVTNNEALGTLGEVTYHLPS